MSLVDAFAAWYFLTAFGWMLAAVRMRRRSIRDYLWCIVWPVGLAVHWQR